MKVKALIALLAATAFAALLLPGAATARVRPANRHPEPPREQVRPEISEQFTLMGTNGFEITLDVTNRRRLILTALKWGNVIESASYSLPLRPRRSSDIVARLGRLGRIDVRFVPGKVHRDKPPRGCHGPKTVIEQGHFVGVIVFRGEHGFTEVHANRAAGAITHAPSLKCPRVAPPPNLKKLRRQLKAIERAEKEIESEEGDEDDDLSVRLSATTRGGRVALAATKVVLKEKHAKPLSVTSILVTGRRQRGRIEEKNAAGYIFGKGSTFLVPNRKRPSSEGVLKPPAPFSGTATFRRHRTKPPTWTGDLKIDLPGFGPVRLAGPGTSASMCDGFACQLRGILSARSLLRRLA